MINGERRWQGEPREGRPGRVVYFPEHLEACEDRRTRKGWVMRGASLKNLAYRRRMRTALETRLVMQLCWQWWISREPGTAGKPGKWGQRPVARLLGVSQVWIWCLAQKFRAQPERWRQRFRAYAPATVEQLWRAMEESRTLRAQGLLAGPVRRWRRYRCLVQGKKRRIAMVTKAELMRREGRPRVRPKTYFDPNRLPHERLPLWARGVMWEPLPLAPHLAGPPGPPPEPKAPSWVPRRGRRGRRW